jgi:gliding motility-associated lipoprotein GldH
VDNDGWERTDTMHFYIPHVQEPGVYQQQVMLRTDNSIPFLGISVIVEQEIYPRGEHKRKRINCPLIEKNGHVMGNGISCYQYSFKVDSVELYEGDSLHVYVMHHMKRETMPGITDVGIEISKN